MTRTPPLLFGALGPAGLLLLLGLAGCPRRALPPEGALPAEIAPDEGGAPPDLAAADLRPVAAPDLAAPDLAPAADLSPALGARFSAATPFIVPLGGSAAMGFNQVHGGYWTVVDLNGDGKADLVETGDALAGRVFGFAGGRYWRLYAGTGAGFGPAVPFPVPQGGGAATGFHQPSGATWALIDLDGDGRLDLVETADAATGKVFGFGAAPAWRLFRNTGVGFSAAAINWSLPAGGQTGAGFNQLYAATWTVLELSGDGKLDLVETADAATGKVFGLGVAPYWRLHVSGGAGFSAAPLSFSVPAGGPAQGFSAAYGVGWTSMDLDGDGMVDLVETADPATGRVFGAGAAPHWRRYKNLGGAFAAAPVSLPVPIGSAGPAGFNAPFGASWTTIDLDGDGRLDLVETADAATGVVFGFGVAPPSWRLYRGGAGGFAIAAAPFPVPAGGAPMAGFYQPYSSYWTLLDLNGDRRPDLVETADQGSGKVFGIGAAPTWRLYGNSP